MGGYGENDQPRRKSLLLSLLSYRLKMRGCLSLGSPSLRALGHLGAKPLIEPVADPVEVLGRPARAIGSAYPPPATEALSSSTATRSASCSAVIGLRSNEKVPLSA